MNRAIFLARHSHFFVVVAGHIQKSLNRQRNICRVVKLELKGDFSVGDLLIKAFILVVCDFTFFSVPDGLEAIELLAIQTNGVADELAELRDHLLHFLLLAELPAVWSQFYCYLGATFEVKVGSITYHELSTAI